MLNKRELICTVAQQTGCTQCEIRKILDTFIEILYEEIKSDGKVQIGGLGVFSSIHQTSRPVRNPQTMEPLMLKPRHTLRFRAADDLVRRLNGEE
ncbi:HU family DNA-binding protein [Parabacteroides sp.]